MKEGSSMNYATALGAASVFVFTVLASQILQDKLERKRRKEEIVLNMRQQYKTNRLRDRLSYTDLCESGDTSRSRRASSSTIPRRQQVLSKNNMSVVTADEDAFGLIPKNSNWRHFESNNEDDIRDGTVTSPSSEGEDDQSSSSSEAFIWTNATVTQKRRASSKKSPRPLGGPTMGPCKRSMSEPSVKSWIGRLKHTVGMRNDNTVATTLCEELSTFDSMSLEEGAVADANNKREMKTPNRSRAFPLSNLPLRRSASTPEMVMLENDGDVTTENRNARAQYNARIMPNKLVMVRHGQSEGNVNEALYSTTPDNAMRLTKLGWEQAVKAGEILKQQVLTSGEPIHFIVSPYVRTVETFHGIVSAWCDPKEFGHIRDREKRLKAWYGRLLELGLTWHEDPRIREQDFGNYQVPEKIRQAKLERHRFGPFFYRFPHGESASDVFDRVSTFLDSLWRSFDLNKSRNYVLVTHGVSIRVLLARYFRYSIDQFSLLANPKNCEMVILGHDGAGKLQLDGRCEIELGEKGETGEMEVKGHAFHERLCVRPKKDIHKLNVRVSYDDNFGPPEMVGYERVTDVRTALIDANGDGSQTTMPCAAADFHTEQSLGA